MVQEPTREVTVGNTQYRSDVDGLRAIAVISVVAYHFGLPLSGGFAGVDVFFVVSGYLITAQIVQGLDRGSFSFVEFYARRLKRLMPAGLVVALAVVVAGYFILAPGDYKSAAASAAYSAIGAANIHFFQNTGYFDSSAEMQPLLHIWSLGIEEQFYAVWPLAAFLIWKFFGRAALPIAMAVITIASFVACAITVTSHPKAAFYLPQYRAWELGIGALIAATSPVSQHGRVLGLQAAGLVMVIASFFVLHKGSPQFPGAAALLPTIGTAALLAAGGNTVISRLLSLSPLRLIGLCSYSLYLWHWPILVFFRHYAHGQHPTAVEACALIVVSFAISLASWKFIEQPFRRLRVDSNRVIPFAGAVLFAFGLGCLAIKVADGLPSRFPDNIVAISSVDRMWQWKCPQSVKADELGGAYCSFGAPWASAQRRAIVWGDSHAEQLAPFLSDAASASGTAVMVYRNCPANIDGSLTLRTIPDGAAYSADCGRHRAAMLRYIEANRIDTVILAAAWTLMIPQIHSPSGSVTGSELLYRGLNATIGEMKSVRKVALIADIPLRQSSPIECEIADAGVLLRRRCGRHDLDLARTSYESSSRDESAIFDRLSYEHVPGVTVYSLSSALCDQTKCATHLNDEIVYMDRHHLRRNLSRETTAQFSTLSGLDRLFLE